MGTKLYVGNLSYDVTENDLQDLFAQAGAVTSVNLMQDRNTGRPRGFAFVEMANEADCAKAISMFNGKEVQGRALTVNEARPREDRPPGGGGGGGYRGGVVVVAAVVVAVAVIVVVAVADAVNTEHSFKTQQRAGHCSGPFLSSGSTSHYSHHIFPGKRF